MPRAPPLISTTLPSTRPMTGYRMALGCARSRSYYFGPSGETLLRPTPTHNTVSEQSRFPLSDYAIA